MVRVSDTESVPNLSLSIEGPTAREGRSKEMIATVRKHAQVGPVPIIALDGLESIGRRRKYVLWGCILIVPMHCFVLSISTLLFCKILEIHKS